MNTHALQVLEYSRILEALTERTATSMGAKLASTLAPATALSEAERRQDETEQARRLLDRFGPMPFGGARDLIGHIEKSLLSGALTPRDLLDVSETLQAAGKLKKHLTHHAEIAPLLASAASDLTDIPDLSRAISSSIDDAGEVKDSASDALARIRRELRTAASRIQERLNSIIQSSSLRTALQDPVIVTRHGRWCVPVRSDHKGSVPGIVHDASSSGATLFVEPQSVVEAGNRLRELEALEAEEVERILRELTARVSVHADELRSTVATLARLDLANAKSLLAELHDACRPVLRQSAYLSFRQARNPLLTGEVVPIDLQLGSGYKGLLITGPNTGGKTVALKTVGLLVLMAQSGLQIPAVEPSECGVFNDIFADIGDEQSIEQSLSTFSGHVRNVVQTLKSLKPRSLVLFDELGAGTDPAEGAAIAAAVLEYLAAHDVCVVATSHYGELKNFAYASDSYCNASVEFDLASLRPTYRLLIGVPGASHAIHIAERLGMPADVLQGAREHLEGQSTSADELMRQVEQSRLRAMEEERRLQQARQEAESLKARAAKDLKKLSQAKEQVHDEVQAEASRVIRETQTELEKVLRELRTQKRHSRNTEGLANKAKRLITKIENVPASAAPAPPVEQEPQERKMRKGDKVRMIGVGTVGTMQEDATETEAVVMFGSIEARVDPMRLELVENPKEPKLPPGRVSIPTSKAMNISPEIMLRGQRVEEALADLDRYLDDAALAGLERVRVIHGKGTGVMRKAVWEFLRKHPLVASASIADLSEGGEGATIAVLK